MKGSGGKVDKGSTAQPAARKEEQKLAKQIFVNIAFTSKNDCCPVPSKFGRSTTTGLDFHFARLFHKIDQFTQTSKLRSIYIGLDRSRLIWIDLVCFLSAQA